MTNKLYVGNLSYETVEDTLKNLFQQHGSVASVRIISDRYSGVSRGFGFVEMSTGEEAQAAIDALNGRDVDGRSIRVNEAHDKSRRDNRW